MQRVPAATRRGEAGAPAAHEDIPIAGPIVADDAAATRDEYAAAEDNPDDAEMSHDSQEEMDTEMMGAVGRS